MALVGQCEAAGMPQHVRVRRHYCLDDAVALFLPVLSLRVSGPLVILDRELLPLGTNLGNVLLCGVDRGSFGETRKAQPLDHQCLRLRRKKGRCVGRPPGNRQAGLKFEEPTQPASGVLVPAEKSAKREFDAK